MGKCFNLSMLLSTSPRPTQRPSVDCQNMPAGVTKDSLLNSKGLSPNYLFLQLSCLQQLKPPSFWIVKNCKKLGERRHPWHRRPQCCSTTWRIVYHHELQLIFIMFQFMLLLFLIKAKISPCLYYRTRLEPHLSITKKAMHAEEENQKPRLCKLIKSTSGFGFRLNAINNIPGVFIKEVWL